MGFVVLMFKTLARRGLKKLVNFIELYIKLYLINIDRGAY